MTNIPHLGRNTRLFFSFGNRDISREELVGVPICTLNFITTTLSTSGLESTNYTVWTVSPSLREPLGVRVEGHYLVFEVSIKRRTTMLDCSSNESVSNV